MFGFLLTVCVIVLYVVDDNGIYNTVDRKNYFPPNFF